MSSEWRRTTWGDIATLEYGKAIRDYQTAKGPFPVYGTNGPIGWHDFPLCNTAGVIVGRKGAYRGVHYCPTPFFVIDTAFYLRPKAELDIRWAYYALLTCGINEMDSGSAIPSTSRDEFYRLPVEVPHLIEQQEIAKFLASFDDRIALLRETNATLEAIAQALFKSWFVDFDPVHANAARVAAEGQQAGATPAASQPDTSADPQAQRAPLPPDLAALFPDTFEDTELGPVLKGWDARPIGEMVEGIFDGPHATPAEADEGPIFLGIKNLTGTGLDLGEIRHISEEDYVSWTRRVTPKTGDIVFSYEATLGFFALIPNSMRCCLGRRLALIRPKKVDGHGHFWFHQLIAPPFQRLLEKHTIHGATVNRIALKEFPRYTVLNPPDSIKSAFESIAGPLWSSIHSNQAQAQTLATLRDTLLPRLISGQLRLPEAETQMTEAIA